MGLKYQRYRRPRGRWLSARDARNPLGQGVQQMMGGGGEAINWIKIRSTDLPT